MGRIPEALNARMNQDPFYQQCCITGVRTERIERHHNLIFAGRQVNEYWAILPLAKSVHDRMSEKNIRDRCDWIMLCRTTDKELRAYCKVTDYVSRKNHLIGRFGLYTGHIIPSPAGATISL